MLNASYFKHQKKKDYFSRSLVLQLISSPGYPHIGKFIHRTVFTVSASTFNIIVTATQKAIHLQYESFILNAIPLKQVCCCCRYVLRSRHFFNHKCVNSVLYIILHITPTAKNQTSNQRIAFLKF